MLTMWSGNVKYRRRGGEDVYEFEIQYKLQGKTVGKTSARESFSVFAASLTVTKVHVGKKSEGEMEVLWF